MDTAEDEERAGCGERDLDSLAGLLGAGIKVERGIEYPHIMGAGVVVDDP